MARQEGPSGRSTRGRQGGQRDGVPVSEDRSGLSEADLAIYRMPGHLIRRLQQVAVSLFLEETAEFDITPVQYAALKAIQTYPGLDQATLAGVIAYDRTTIGGVVDRLEDKGLVRRTLSETDRRVRRLMIEPKGESLLESLDPAVERVQQRMLSPLGREERMIFMLLLAKLTDANNERSRAPLRPIPTRATSGADA